MHRNQNQVVHNTVDQHNSLNQPLALNVNQPKQSGLITQDAWKGVYWKLLSCLSFAGLNAIVRYLTGGSGQISTALTPSQLTFLQNAVGCLFLLPWLLNHPRSAFKTNQPRLHALRVICAVSGLIMLYYAFKHMPVAQAVSLQFVGPIFTVIGAWTYLKEKVDSMRFTGLILGLLGVFVITRPDLALTSDRLLSLDYTALLPIGSALAFAVAKLLGRQLAVHGESAHLLTTYLVVFMVPVSFLPALFDWSWPTLPQWGLIGVLGFFAWAGHFSMAKAYGYAEILFLLPFGFSRLLFSALIAYMIFGELPKSLHFWLGTVIIMSSAILITVAEERLKKKKIESVKGLA